MEGSERDMGPVEADVERILRFELGSLPWVQRAFTENRELQRSDLDDGDDLVQVIALLTAQTRGLREAILRIARELDELHL